MHRESLWRLRFCTRPVNFAGLRMLYAISTFAFLAWSTGCAVRGFQTIPDGLAIPSQLRAGAAVNRAQAEALDEIANQNEGFVQRIADGAQQVAQGIGAPAVLTGLIGASAGLVVPSPGQRRRERVAAAEAKADATK